ncbi:DUF917 domain-containing protein [Nonomuraea sp. NPDC001684]
MLITLDHVDTLAIGATLLGSGGGGDTAIVSAMLTHALTEHGPVPLVSTTDLPADALVVPVAATGSITLMLERPPSGPEFAHVVNMVGHHLGQTPRAVTGFEVGGANGLFAVAAAAWTGLPLVDADGMGRAFPGVDQVTFNAGGISAVPAALADPSGNHVVLTGAATNAAAERLLRATLPALGGWAATAIYPMSAEQAGLHAIRGSISRALALGERFQHAQRNPRTRIQMLADHEAGLLFTGTVAEILRHARPRTGATITIAHDSDPYRALRIEVADEYLLAIQDGEIVAQVPDIIAVLDYDTWQPITAEQIGVGRTVQVVRLPGPAEWTTRQAAPLVAPAAFGLRDLDADALLHALEGPTA